jgi:hypothetical protein
MSPLRSACGIASSCKRTKKDGKQQMRTAIAAAAFALSAGSSMSAEFSKEPRVENGTTISGDYFVHVSGKIEWGDENTFERITTGDRTDIVVLSGPGGNEFAGIMIGENIRDRHFLTIVAKNDVCASACAFAWLGGEKRFVWRSSYLGFHAAYEQAPGETARTNGSGNAVLGAYLTKLGLSYAAVIYMTSPELDQIQWFSIEDAARLQIPIEVMDDDNRPQPMGRNSTPTLPQRVPSAPPAPPVLPALQVPSRPVRGRAHPEWRPLKEGSREFNEIQASCTPYPADQVSACWYEERESYDWAVRNRAAFPTEKFPEAREKRAACWTDPMLSSPTLRFTTYKLCMIKRNERWKPNHSRALYHTSRAGFQAGRN